MNITIMFSE